MREYHTCGSPMHIVATALKIARLVYYRIQWENMQVSEHVFKALCNVQVTTVKKKKRTSNRHLIGSMALSVVILICV